MFNLVEEKKNLSGIKNLIGPPCSLPSFLYPPPTVVLLSHQSRHNQTESIHERKIVFSSHTHTHLSLRHDRRSGLCFDSL